jgi:hypothetical protein
VGPVLSEAVHPLRVPAADVSHRARRKCRTRVAEPRRGCSQLDSVGAEGFSHLPEGLVELEIFIDAFNGRALRHPGPVSSAARVVALTATDSVFLNRVQDGPKVLRSISETSRVEQCLKG